MPLPQATISEGAGRVEPGATRRRGRRPMSHGTHARRQLRSSVQALMEDLGPSVGSIADRLGRLGVHGRPGDEERCALSNYLRLVVGTEPVVRSVAVRPHAVHVRVSRFGPSVRVPLSLEAQAFIAAFDAGLYPRLVVERRDQEPLALPINS